MNIEDRIARLEAAVFPQPTPDPHPLAGLEFKNYQAWQDPTYCRREIWLRPKDYTNFPWRDSTTHAPVPLWQVAKRLGVEHPVPAEVRWTDVEWRGRGSWKSLAMFSKKNWVNDPSDKERDFRLTAQYDHQPITYAQFHEILSREDKPEPTDFRVGDLVEVVEDRTTIKAGERFYVRRVFPGSVYTWDEYLWVDPANLRLISRPTNPNQENTNG